MGLMSTTIVPCCENNVEIIDKSLVRVGKNIPSNRLKILSNTIDLDWLNQLYIDRVPSFDY